MSTWKYNRMYAARARTPIVKVEDPTIPTRIDALLGNGLVNDWETNFLSSIKAGYDKYKSLTEGQNRTFQNIEARYSPDAVAARQSWQSTWDAVKAETFKSMMEYYSTTPYYPGVVEKWKKNNSYIPSEKEYKDTCENKYSVKYLKALTIPPKHKVGALVVHKEYGGYKLATIVDIGNVRDWSKGSREYQINVVGSPDLVWVREKELLYYREGMNSKIQKNDNDSPF